MNKQSIKVYGVLGVAGLCLLLSAGASAEKPAKVDVCHAPPDNPENIQYIQVGSKGGALADHLAHGDWPVTEEVCDAIADNNCDGSPDPYADYVSCMAILGVGSYCMAGVCEPPDFSTPIGIITATIFRGGTPSGTDRGVESAAGNLVADAHRWATLSNGAEIAFMNPGGLRSDLTYPQS